MDYNMNQNKLYIGLIIVKIEELLLLFGSLSSFCLSFLAINYF